jgi:HPt (histidine-containing phosphotransfer) domain-containing protein
MRPSMPTGPESNLPRLPAWDEAAAIAAVDGDGRLAREIVAALISGLPADLAELKSFAASRDAAALAEAAHHMRGATRYCGVLALDAALDDLEQAATAGDTGRTAAELARVETEVTRLTAAFA